MFSTGSSQEHHNDTARATARASANCLLSGLLLEHALLKLLNLD